MSRNIARLQSQFDAQAIEQLRAEVVRLSAENEDLRDRLSWAEQNAEFWARDATELHLQLCEAHLGIPGVTPQGQLVMVQH